MRDTNHTPVEARFNLDIPMPHVHMTIPEMMSMGLAPDEYSMDEDSNTQLVYFGYTAHATYNPDEQEYFLCLGNHEWGYKGAEVVQMCAALREFMEDEGVLLKHMERYDWAWANTVANNLDEDRFWAEVRFLFERDGNVIDNMAGEGDDMFQFHVNDYQVFGLQTPDDDYRVIKWVDGDAQVVGHYNTLAEVRAAITLHEAQEALTKARQQYDAMVMDKIGELLMGKKN